MAIERIETKYGTVFRADRCKDDYGTLRTSGWYRRKGIPFKKRAVYVTLQKPALDAFRRAEDVLGFQIFTTGSHRTCEFQAAKYREDPKRFAHPNEGVHTQGLAIDVDSGQLDKRGKDGRTVREVLRAVGWKQSRPEDEPWHFSWGVTA